MKIVFALDWIKPGKSVASGIKLNGAYSLILEYTKRISKFTPCEISGRAPRNVKKSAGTILWVCDRGPRAKILSSELLAKNLGEYRDQGIKTWEIVIGGADGFSGEDLELLRPQVLWCFGPLTLPHELAAAVAAEQVYRAWTIIKGQPYHLGH